jgi:hypothetical protein
MEKIIITIILVYIEITIIQTIIFEYENKMYLFSMSLPKTICDWELIQKGEKENVKIENNV